MPALWLQEYLFRCLNGGERFGPAGLVSLVAGPANKICGCFPQTYCIHTTSTNINATLLQILESATRHVHGSLSTVDCTETIDIKSVVPSL